MSTNDQLIQSTVVPPIPLDGNLFDWTHNCPRHLQISSWTIVRAFKSGEFFPTSPFPDSFGGQQIDPKYRTCHRMTTFCKHLLLHNRNSSAPSEHYPSLSEFFMSKKISKIFKKYQVFARKSFLRNFFLSKFLNFLWWHFLLHFQSV